MNPNTNPPQNTSQRPPEETAAEIKAILNLCEFFKNLTGDEVNQVATIAAIADYPVGSRLFRQGELGEHLYVIARGKVVLERSVDLGPRQGMVPIEILGPGRVLGCWSSLLGTPHILMSSATCQMQSRVVAIQGSALRELMCADALFGFNLLERLCFLLRDRIQAAYGAFEKI